MISEVTSFVVGAAVGSAFVACVAYPRVGRVFCRIFGVLALAIGAGLFTWALYSVLGGESMHAIDWQGIILSQPSEAFGWSAGFALGGISALVLAAQA